MDGSPSNPPPIIAAEAKRERNKLRHERNKQWHHYTHSMHSQLRERSDPAPGAESAPRGAMRYGPAVKRPGLASEQRCTFLLVKKKRNCSRTRLPGSCFCVNHQNDSPAVNQDAGVSAEIAEVRQRVQCELCGDTMWGDKAPGHAVRCNAAMKVRQQQALSCWSGGVNSGERRTT
jgi:hypothetical protein